MTASIRSTAALLIAAAIVALAGCAGSTPPSAAPADLEFVCEGEGDPVVILDTGSGGTAADFASLQAELAATTRVCAYSRAGLGGSPAWPDDEDDPSAGAQAEQLAATLAAEEIPGPYIVLGWSWGGVVTQALAARHPELLAGAVLQDAPSSEQFDDPIMAGLGEGGRTFDLDTTAQEIDGLDMGSIPLLVLTQGSMEDFDADDWLTTQDRLASLSDDSLHVIATEAGHAVHLDAEALVVKAVEELVAAVRADEPLEPCDDGAWSGLAGECRPPL